MQHKTRLSIHKLYLLSTDLQKCSVKLWLVIALKHKAYLHSETASVNILEKVRHSTIHNWKGLVLIGNVWRSGNYVIFKIILVNGDSCSCWRRPWSWPTAVGVEGCLAKLQLVIQCDNKKQSGLQKHPQFSGGEAQDKSLENALLIKRLQCCFLLLKYWFVTYE